MKITHWGEDYATLKVGTREFEVSIRLAEAIEKLLKKNKAAVALGSIKSEKKSKSSRENGKKGGRPVKVPK